MSCFVSHATSRRRPVLGTAIDSAATKATGGSLHNQTAEQIDSHSQHHDADEPLDQTIRIAGEHTPRSRLSHTAQSGGKEGTSNGDIR